MSHESTGMRIHTLAAIMVGVLVLFPALMTISLGMLAVLSFFLGLGSILSAFRIELPWATRALVIACLLLLEAFFGLGLGQLFDFSETMALETSEFGVMAKKVFSTLIIVSLSARFLAIMSSATKTR